jgi:DNA polymerase IV
VSVLCCNIPDFLIRLHLRRHPQQEASPLALLGGDGRVWAASALARECGVGVDLTASQARLRCPDLRLFPLQSDEAEAEQSAFLGRLAAGGLPVESLGWGAAYLDLRWLATDRAKVEPFCVDIGRALRQELGEALTPSLGWDSGKFTARAAALAAEPGHMRLVDRRDEVSFLGPLPIALLPLPAQALQNLAWLGIRTLGQYAALPEVAVWQRFGQAGKLARAWARGRDTRPVQPTVGQKPESVTVTFDQPEGLLGPVLDAVMAALHPRLAEIIAQMAGIRRLRLQLHFLDNSSRTVDIAYVEAVDQEARLHAVLRHKLETVNWPAEVEAVTLWILETGERSLAQGFLFPEFNQPAAGSSSVETQNLAPLQGRYGSIFFQGNVVDAHHPVPERRTVLYPRFSSHPDSL